MLIKNEFSHQEIRQLAPQIHRLILAEPLLTNRSLAYVERHLRNGTLFVAMAEGGGQVIGFVIKERLTGNYYEIKSWYVTPRYRESGLAYQLLNRATQDGTHVYLGVTFQEDIIKGVGALGFKPITLNQLPLRVFLRYIFTRHRRSILRHFLGEKSTLMVKK